MPMPNCTCSSLMNNTEYTVQVTGQKCGDIAIFECIIGYYMKEGGQQRTAVCLNGFWSVTTVRCQGTS